ncbi:hypothetical protein [Methylobacterium nonmethylotrophicum]|uniref:Uncharacterized protein n=1 Tax=Methylobacterium nonmethylotrophicum TaxID=1141884 RepID=A0A4Z0NMR5_9HYPH|nr:hypothetical protein [Methylobacterium nonmethylotrophicum]TGD97935.1 hypothetical protein EU555_17365 [Methylobacterium nonmethylotrophicum]
MTLRLLPAWLPVLAALAAAPAVAADMPPGIAVRGGAGVSAGWAPPPPPPPAVALEAEVILAGPPPRPLLGFGYAPVLPYYGVSTGPYGYPPRREPGIGAGLF